MIGACAAISLVLPDIADMIDSRKWFPVKNENQWVHLEMLVWTADIVRPTAQPAAKTA